MNKINKGLKLSIAIIDEIDRKHKEENFNFSDWVETKFHDEFLTEKGMNLQIKKAKEYLEKVKNHVKYTLKKRQKWGEFTLKNIKKEGNLPPLLKAKKLIRQDSKYLNGQWKLWNNTFKDNKLSKLEFIELLELV